MLSLNSLVLFTLLFDSRLEMIEHILDLLVVLILIEIRVEIFAVAKDNDFVLLELCKHT